MSTLSPALRAHLLVALRAHIRQLRRDGRPVPAEVRDFAGWLSGDAAVRDAQARRRVLAAARSARYRARRKGLPVPLHKPGPAPDRDELDRGARCA